MIRKNLVVITWVVLDAVHLLAIAWNEVSEKHHHLPIALVRGDF